MSYNFFRAIGLSPEKVYPFSLYVLLIKQDHSFMNNQWLKPGSICKIAGLYRAYTLDDKPTYTTKLMRVGTRFPASPQRGFRYRLESVSLV